MSLHVGRLVLPEPLSWASTGASRVQVVGNYKATSLADGLVRRDQFLSLADDLDTPVLPITSDVDPRINGYYRVLGVTFTTDEFVRQQGNLYDYRLDLQPIQGFAAPYLESIVSGALLTNAVGAVVADMIGFHSVPVAATEYFSPISSGAPSAATRSNADGTMEFLYASGGASAVTGVGRMGLAPANFYLGAATIEQGSPLRPVIGRTLAQNDFVNWRLSNGMVRVTPNATAGKLDVSHYTPSGWSPIKTYTIGINAGALFTIVNSLIVLRNSVEEVAIRLSLGLSGGAFTGVSTLDLSLRRGDLLVRGLLTSTLNNVWQVSRDVTEAATAITYGAVTLGGMRATNNDGAGNRYILLSYQATPVTDLVNGSVRLSLTGKTMDFGIGLEILGSLSAAPNRAVDIAQEYLAAQSESQRVVAR